MLRFAVLSLPAPSAATIVSFAFDFSP